MFKELMPLLAKVEAVTLTLSATQDGKVIVNVIPMAKGEAHFPSLQLTASAEDLDTGFAEAITTFRASTESLADQTAAYEKEAEEAKKAADEARKAQAEKAGKATEENKPSRPATAPAKTSAAKPAVETPSMDALF